MELGCCEHLAHGLRYIRPRDPAFVSAKHVKLWLQGGCDPSSSAKSHEAWLPILVISRRTMPRTGRAFERKSGPAGLVQTWVSVRHACIWGLCYQQSINDLPLHALVPEWVHMSPLMCVNGSTSHPWCAPCARLLTHQDRGDLDAAGISRRAARS